MTRAKKLKRAIRTRGRKTGERYAAARRHVLAARERKKSDRGSAAPGRPAALKPSAPRPSVGGAVSDAAARKRTGHGLDHWFAVLDAFGAVKRGHSAAARHLSDDHGVDGWFAQGITVAYERARGLRAPHQRMSGLYEVSVSKVLEAPVEEVANAIARAERRARWLQASEPLAQGLEAALSGPEARKVAVRPGKDARLRYPTDGLTIEIRVTAKPGGRSSIVAQSMKLPNAKAVDTYREAWRAAFEALRTHLSG